MNISEFAREAGVSKSAVSRYFNDGYLSEDKREMIEKAIERTGYAPNIQAQNVRTKITKLVGVIIPKLSSESCARVTEGISQVLNEKGYQVILVNTANNPQKELESLELFRKNRVDGVIFLASVFTPTHEMLLKKMRIPVVIVGQHYKGFNCVCHDDMNAAYALTQLMLEKGCKKPAYIGVTTEDRAAGYSRKEGFLKAVSDAGIQTPDEYMTEALFNTSSGYEKTAELFRKTEQKKKNGLEQPDCIFCATDNIAAGAMLYLKEHQIRVPEDVMIASVGDSALCKTLSTPLTSAHFHYKTSGSEAASMLLTAMKQENLIPRVTRLDFDIMERESTLLEEKTAV